MSAWTKPAEEESPEQREARDTRDAAAHLETLALTDAQREALRQYARSTAYVLRGRAYHSCDRSCGRDAQEMRQAVLSALSGLKIARKQAGANATIEAVANALDIGRREQLCRAERDHRIAACLNILFPTEESLRGQSGGGLAEAPPQPDAQEEPGTPEPPNCYAVGYLF